MANTLKLTRDQLAQFLSDHQQIKQFEKLFGLTDEYLNSGMVDAISIEAGNAGTAANDALTQVSRLTQDVDLLALAPPIVHSVAQVASGGLALDAVEVDLGASKTGGKFTIAGVGMTIGKPVLIQQAVGPYTGKGTRADEAEMDQVSVSASVTAANTITAYWASPRRVRGNFKFNYQVSA